MHKLGISTVLSTLALLPMATPALARSTTDYALHCQFELKPKGYYTYDASRGIPVVKPAQGGTKAEADALNACIRAKAAGQGSATAGVASQPVRESAAAPTGAAPDAKPRYTKRKRGAAVLSGGAGYHGSYLEGGTGNTFAGATVVAEPRKTKRARRGLAPLPSGYPLMPGDEALWYSLTPAQQQRARQFLEDGSTIRSSLQPD